MSATIETEIPVIRSPQGEVRERSLSLSPPRWTFWALGAAGVYNLAWGAFAILFPLALFRWTGFDPMPNYPALWQCIGMIVGVYGVGYLIAAGDSRRHWPIVLVGLLGKLFGPIGFLNAAMTGELPWTMGWTLLTNDLIWWAPFTAILWDAWKHRQGAERSCRE